MSAGRAAAGPLAAGVSAAILAFAIVALATGGGAPGSQIAGPGLQPPQDPDRGRRASQGSPPRAGRASGDSRASATRALNAAAAAGHDDGRAVFARMGCGSCHRLAAAGSEGEIGPNLDERLAYHTRASLAAKIVDPSQGLGEGFSMMPDDFESRMTGDELQALVEFLLAARPGH
jgi:cytochrome c551/c552